MPTQYVVTTATGREKLAKAHVGDISLPAITQMGFGTEGADPITGDPTMPTGNETEVGGEVVRKNIEGYTFPIATTVRITGILDFEEGNGNNISAIGLYDSAGDLIALKHTTAKPKSADTRLEITWDEQF